MASFIQRFFSLFLVLVFFGVFFDIQAMNGNGKRKREGEDDKKSSEDAVHSADPKRAKTIEINEQCKDLVVAFLQLRDKVERDCDVKQDKEQLEDLIKQAIIIAQKAPRDEKGLSETVIVFASKNYKWADAFVLVFELFGQIKKILDEKAQAPLISQPQPQPAVPEVKYEVPEAKEVKNHAQEYRVEEPSDALVPFERQGEREGVSSRSMALHHGPSVPMGQVVLFQRSHREEKSNREEKIEVKDVELTLGQVVKKMARRGAINCCLCVAGMPVLVIPLALFGMSIGGRMFEEGFTLFNGAALDKCIGTCYFVDQTAQSVTSGIPRAACKALPWVVHGATKGARTKMDHCLNFVTSFPNIVIFIGATVLFVIFLKNLCREKPRQYHQA